MEKLWSDALGLDKPSQFGKIKVKETGNIGGSILIHSRKPMKDRKMTEKTRNPSVARRYVDADGKQTLIEGAFIGTPVAIRFYQPVPDTEVEDRPYLEVSLDAASDPFRAYAMCHGVAQLIGDKFNEHKGDWDAIAKYIGERREDVNKSQWKVPGTGAGGKSTLWMVAFGRICARAIKQADAGNKKAAEVLKALLDFTKLSLPQLGDPIVRLAWMKDTATDEQRAVIKKDPGVAKEKVAMDEEKLNKTAPSAFGL